MIHIQTFEPKNTSMSNWNREVTTVHHFPARIPKIEQRRAKGETKHDWHSSSILNRPSRLRLHRLCTYSDNCWNHSLNRKASFKFSSGERSQDRREPSHSDASIIFPERFAEECNNKRTTASFLQKCLLTPSNEFSRKGVFGSPLS